MSMTTPAGDPAGGIITLPSPGAQALPANATPQQLDTYIQTHYGYMAWALAIPELRTILEQSVNASGPTVDQNTLDGMIRGTKWYQDTTQAMRSWVQMQGEDPATAQAQVDKASANISQEASLMGVNLDPQSLTDMAHQSIAFQWDKTMLDQALQGEATRQLWGNQGQAPGRTVNQDIYGAYGVQEHGGAVRQITGDPFGGGLMSDYYTQVNQLAHDYMVTVDPATASKWAIAMSTGQMDAKAVEGYMIHMATGKFPGLQQVIQSGITPQQYFQPLQAQVAKTLELTPDQVRWDDPKYAPILQYHDPNTNQVRPMTLSEADNWARQQPEWNTTAAANQASAALVKTLATTFGAIK